MHAQNQIELNIRDDLEQLGAELGLPPIHENELISSNYSETMLRIGEITLSCTCTLDTMANLRRYYKLMEIGMYAEMA